MGGVLWSRSGGPGVLFGLVGGVAWLVPLVVVVAVTGSRSGGPGVLLGPVRGVAGGLSALGGGIGPTRPVVRPVVMAGGLPALGG
ncbi:hypothetical protein ACFFQW_32865, partial [Umezawaea endophytica]